MRTESARSISFNYRADRPHQFQTRASATQRVNPNRIVFSTKASSGTPAPPRNALLALGAL
jgi:hypothetical protein